jgi:hypothetical protein
MASCTAASRRPSGALCRSAGWAHWRVARPVRLTATLSRRRAAFSNSKFRGRLAHLRFEVVEQHDEVAVDPGFRGH